MGKLSLQPQNYYFEQNRIEARLQLQNLLFSFRKALNAAYLFQNWIKILNYSLPQLSLSKQTSQFFTNPYVLHSYFSYFYTYYVIQPIFIRLINTITSVMATLFASKAFFAEIQGFMNWFILIELCSITHEVSVVFFIVRGVVIPCDSFPSPLPTLYPNFCIILKAIYYLQSKACYSYQIEGPCFQMSAYSAILCRPIPVLLMIFLFSFYICTSQFQSSANFSAQQFIERSKLFGKLGSYQVDISLLFFYTFYGLGTLGLVLSADLLAPMFKFIFFDVNMVFSFELILAKDSFFLSATVLVIGALADSFYQFQTVLISIYFALILVYFMAIDYFQISVKKLSSFFYISSSLLGGYSLEFPKLGKGGGRFPFLFGSILIKADYQDFDKF